MIDTPRKAAYNESNFRRPLPGGEKRNEHPVDEEECDLKPNSRFVSLVLAGALALTASTGAFAAATPETALPEEGIILEEGAVSTVDPEPAPAAESPAPQAEVPAEEPPVSPLPAAEEDDGTVGEEGAETTFDSSFSGSSLLDPNSSMVPSLISATFYYDEAHKVLTLVNQIRSQYGLNPLTWDSELEETAVLRAAECSVSFSHTRPNGESCFSLYPDNTSSGGENIAAGYANAEAVVNGWMNSPGHRANILNPNYTTMAVGMVQASGTRYGYYWSQNFTGYWSPSTTGDGQYAYSGTAAKTVVSEAVGTAAQVAVKNFVIRLYELVLGRAPETDGLANWYNALITGSQTGAEAAQGFFFSEEFLNKNTSDIEYLETLYRTMLDRPSDSNGLAYWLDVMDTGFSRTYIYRGFAESAEFTGICANAGIVRGSVTMTESRDLNPGVTGFVSRLYSIAFSRTPDAGGLNNWTAAILGGARTPEQVGYEFFFSTEMKMKNLSDEEFVTLLYRVFLDREPDKNGINDWVSCMKAGMKRDAILYGISKSAEFNTILNSFGLSATQGEMVYVVAADNNYHTAGCAKMTGKRTIPLLLQDAVNIGYTPCTSCR